MGYPVVARCDAPVAADVQGVSRRTFHCAGRCSHDVFRSLTWTEGAERPWQRAFAPTTVGACVGQVDYPKRRSSWGSLFGSMSTER